MWQTCLLVQRAPLSIHRESERAVCEGWAEAGHGRRYGESQVGTVRLAPRCTTASGDSLATLEVQMREAGISCPGDHGWEFG